MKYFKNEKLSKVDNEYIRKENFKSLYSLLKSIKNNNSSKNDMSYEEKSFFYGKTSFVNILNYHIDCWDSLKVQEIYPTIDEKIGIIISNGNNTFGFIMDECTTNIMELIGYIVGESIIERVIKNNIESILSTIPFFPVYKGWNYEEVN